MLVKVMTTHNISPIQQIAQVEVCAICSYSYHTTRLVPCLHLRIRSKRTMWARITILQRTIHTPTLTMQGGEPTPIFHGVNTQNVQNPQGQQRNFQ
jgi:hypothetical protein